MILLQAERSRTRFTGCSYSESRSLYLRHGIEVELLSIPTPTQIREGSKSLTNDTTHGSCAYSVGRGFSALASRLGSDLSLGQY